MNGLKVGRTDADDAGKGVRRLRGERDHMVSDIAAIRNEQDDARMLNEIDRGLNMEAVGICEDRVRLKRGGS